MSTRLDNNKIFIEGLIIRPKNRENDYATSGINNLLQKIHCNSYGNVYVEVE